MTETKLLDKIRLDLQVTWTTIKDTIGMQLLGSSDPLVVPHFDESKQFSLYGVFVKLPKTTKEKLMSRPPSMAYAGTLEDFVILGPHETFQNLVSQPTRVEKSFNENYHYSLSDMRKGGILKSVDVKLNKCQYHRVERLEAGRTIDIKVQAFGTLKPRSIYVITDCWTVHGYDIKVKIGDRDVDANSSDTVPIAFMFQKYPVLHSGSVGELSNKAKKMKVKKAKKKIWLRKSEFFLAPGVDPSKRHLPKDT